MRLCSMCVSRCRLLSIRIVECFQALLCSFRGIGVPGVDRLLVGRPRARRITQLPEQVPEVDRRCRGLVGVPGVDRLLVGRPRARRITQLPEQVPEVDRRCRGLVGVPGVGGLGPTPATATSTVA